MIQATSTVLYCPCICIFHNQDSNDSLSSPSSISRDAANEKTTLVDSDQAQARPPKRKPSITTSSGSNYLEMYSYDAFIARESYTVLVVRQKSGKKTQEEELDGKKSISYFRLSNGSTSEKSTYRREARCYKRLKESSLWQLMR